MHLTLELFPIQDLEQSNKTTQEAKTANSGNNLKCSLKCYKKII